MAAFDRIDGLFVVVHCTFEERVLFRDGGWTRRNKKWVTDSTKVAMKLRKYAVGAARAHLDNAAMFNDAQYRASWAENTDANFPSPEGLAYMPFQKSGIEYAVERTHTLIGDPPGLGKTIQAIGVHNVVMCQKVLVVCPASLKDNWKKEWLKWDVHGLSVGIAFSKSRSKTTDGVTERWTEYHWPDTDVVIINYDMLAQFDDEVKGTEWDLMICDEAHLLKTRKALRTLCVFGGRRKGTKTKRDEWGNRVPGRKAKHYEPITSERSLFLTGTPILSRPAELWTIIKACDPTGLGRNWTKYVERYCGAWYDGFGMDIKGATNTEELHRLLRERFMVRRDKKAVLSELPDKVRELITISGDKLEAVQRKEESRAEAALNAYEAALGIDTRLDLIETIKALSDKLEAALEAQDTEEPSWEKAVKALSEPDAVLFTQLSSLREEVALAKVGAVVDHIMTLHDCEEPVIAFAHHTSVIEEITKRLEDKGLRVGVITGKVPSNKRQPIVDDFQDGKYDVIIGNLMAMGVGFTLTRSSIVVFAELDWVPAMIEQGEDRAWRIGQENCVLVQHLVVNGTIEAIMAHAILAKMEVIWKTLDDKESA